MVDAPNASDPKPESGKQKEQRNKIGFASVIH